MRLLLQFGFVAFEFRNVPLYCDVICLTVVVAHGADAGQYRVNVTAIALAPYLVLPMAGAEQLLPYAGVNLSVMKTRPYERKSTRIFERL